MTSYYITPLYIKDMLFDLEQNLNLKTCRMIYEWFVCTISLDKLMRLVLQIYDDFEQHVYNTLTKEFLICRLSLLEVKQPILVFLLILYQIYFTLCRYILTNLRKCLFKSNIRCFMSFVFFLMHKTRWFNPWLLGYRIAVKAIFLITKLNYIYCF